MMKSSNPSDGLSLLYALYVQIWRIRNIVIGCFRFIFRNVPMTKRNNTEKRKTSCMERRDVLSNLIEREIERYVAMHIRTFDSI